MSRQSPYVLLTGSLDDIQHQANQYVANGYVPAGGPVKGEDRYLGGGWVQAMHKPQTEHARVTPRPLDPTPQAMLHPAQRPDNVGEKGLTLRDLEFYAQQGGETLLLLEKAYRIAAGTGYTGEESDEDHKTLVAILIAVEGRTRYLIGKVREYSGRAPLTTIDYQNTSHTKLLELIRVGVSQNDNLVCAAMAIDACMRLSKPQGLVIEFEMLRAVRKALAGYETAQYQDPLVTEFMRLADTGTKEVE